MAFSIEVRFLGGLTATQQVAFESAASRWQQIITGDLPRVRFRNEIIDGILITAQGVRIDGLGDPVTGTNTLGQAAPLAFRPGSQLPAFGFMEFDTADLLNLELRGGLEDLILHEMGHVLGIGTIWSRLSLLQGAGTIDPVFLGVGAMREYAALIDAAEPAPVPVANRGGRGSRDGHWRESILLNELMSPMLDAGTNPISRFTIASLADLGYDVSLDAADPFELPTAFQLASMGISADEEVSRRCSQCGSVGRLPDPVQLPEEALVD
ncbi:MAG: peptidase [Planctomycetes bacterium]|nr:peptidase [Planctomycetota bacterium]